MQTPPPGYQGPYDPPKKKNTALWIILGVLGGGCCLCIPIGAAVVFPVFAQARLSALKTQGLSNAKVTATAVVMYTADYDDRLPLADRWMDGINQYLGVAGSSATQGGPTSPLRSPAVNESEGFGFAFRSSLASKKTQTLPDHSLTALIFDSTNLARNASGELNLLPSPGRYPTQGSKGNIVAFLDTSARVVPDAQKSSLK